MMDIKKISSFENLVTPETRSGGVSRPGNGPSFEDTLNKIQSPQNGMAQPGLGIQPNSGLNQVKPQADAVKFSNHAIERMQSRGISFNQNDIQKLNEAVSRASAKGSKDTLVLMNDSALIVSVKNKTVVTVMDKTALKENVFTNIDSTIVM
ncbi:MAG: TIGR02530 family flagellar biosynthesis protein [Pseudobdellovibrionaceae bacterium]|jgi:flagellar operon protein